MYIYFSKQIYIYNIVPIIIFCPYCETKKIKLVDEVYHRIAFIHSEGRGAIII